MDLGYIGENVAKPNLHTINIHTWPYHVFSPGKGCINHPQLEPATRNHHGLQCCIRFQRHRRGMARRVWAREKGVPLSRMDVYALREYTVERWCVNGVLWVYTDKYIYIYIFIYIYICFSIYTYIYIYIYIHICIYIYMSFIICMQIYIICVCVCT